MVNILMYSKIAYYDVCINRWHTDGLCSMAHNLL